MHTATGRKPRGESMGSYIPFADDQPFALKVKTLADEELLEIWEETQQIEGIIRKELHTDMKLTPEYEQVIVAELSLRSGRRLAERKTGDAPCS